MLTSEYTTWDALSSYIRKNLGLDYSGKNVHPLHKGLSLDGRLPYSISEYEFNYMKSFIETHGLKCGFELATGIGISTLCIGYGMLRTGGTLSTVDSYVEDQKQNIPISPSRIETSDEAFLRNRKLINLFGLSETVSLFKGWSPTDCIIILSSLGRKLDFVFLDCPKTTKDFRRDASYIKDYLDNDFAIFVHDTHTYDKKAYDELCRSFFGTSPAFISSYGGIKVHFPLSVITNLKLNLD